MNQPTIDTLTRVDGIAGQYGLRAHVTYRDEQGGVASEHWVLFTGSVYGAPVVMVTEHGQTHVTDWTRHGDTLNDDWVRSFFAAGDL